jgi:hypothetical protein
MALVIGRRIDATLAHATSPSFSARFARSLLNSTTDTLRACTVGIAALLGVQALFILFTGFDGNSALYWLGVAQAVDLPSVSLGKLTLLLTVLVAAGATWPHLRIVSPALRVLKWYKRLSIATQAACGFLLVGAVSTSLGATAYAVRLTPDQLRPAPMASLTARQAAIAALDEILRTMNDAEREHVTLTLARIYRNGAPELEMRAFAKDFAERVTWSPGAPAADEPNAPTEPSGKDQNRSAETIATEPSEPERSSRAKSYQDIREAVSKVFAGSVGQFAHAHGLEWSDGFVGGVVDHIVAAMAKAVFEQVVPASFESWREVATWVQRGTVGVRNVEQLVPRDDLTLVNWDAVTTSSLLPERVSQVVDALRPTQAGRAATGYGSPQRRPGLPAKPPSTRPRPPILLP